MSKRNKKRIDENPTKEQALPSNERVPDESLRDSRRNFVWKSLCAASAGIAIIYGLTRACKDDNVLHEGRTYTITRKQTYPDSSHIIFVPDIHSEEQQQTNKAILDEILSKLHIDVVGLEGLTGIVTNDTVWSLNEGKKKNLEEVNRFVDRYTRSFQDLFEQIGIDAFSETLHTYLMASFTDVDYDPPGLVYAMRLLTTQVHILGVDEKKIRDEGLYLLRKKNAELAKEIVILLEKERDTEGKKEIIAEMKTTLSKYPDTPKDIDAKRYEEINDARSRIAVQTLEAYITQKGLRTGLLVYGTGHSQEIRKTLEERRISYTEIKAK